MSKKKKEEYSKLKEEIEKNQTQMVPLQYVCEEKAQQIEKDIDEESEMVEKIKDIPDPYRFAGYNPNVIDFIRRCDTNEQAYEILDFLEKKGEITNSEAIDLRKQIDEKGLRSFGEKKESGFYFHHE